MWSQIRFYFVHNYTSYRMELRLLIILILIWGLKTTTFGQLKQLASADFERHEEQRVSEESVVEDSVGLNSGETCSINLMGILLGVDVAIKNGEDTICVPTKSAHRKRRAVLPPSGETQKRGRRVRRQASSNATIRLKGSPYEYEVRNISDLFNQLVPADAYDDFIELLGDDDIFHQLRPAGYAFHPRTKLLEFYPFDPKDPVPFTNIYPPFTYDGLYGPDKWHTIPFQKFLKLKNRSFMLLKHRCQDSGFNPGHGKHQETLDVMLQCEKDQYSNLPRCDSDFQSPIDIATAGKVSSILRNYDYQYLDQKVEFLMSLPWDGTNLLSVEPLTAEKDPMNTYLYHKNNAEQVVRGANQTNITQGPNGADSKIPEIRPIPEISAGALTGGTLYLERIYIKYGVNETVGSEHQLDGKTFGMELQFIFTKEGRQFIKKYWDLLMNYYTSSGLGENVEESFGDNVHIISIFVKVVDSEEEIDDEWSKSAAEEFKLLCAAAKRFWRVHNKPDFDKEFATDPFFNKKYRARGFKTKKNSEMTRLNLSRLIPPKEFVEGEWRHSPYYTYRGGLTHPPCFEHIDYGIYEKPITITKESWRSFKFIPSVFDDTRFLAGNFRPLNSIYYKSTDLKLQRDREKVEAARLRIQNRRILKSTPNTLAEETVHAEDFDYFESHGSRSLMVENIYYKVLIFIIIIIVEL